MSDRPSRSTRDYGRSAALLTVAIGVSGVLVYVFFALASHALDRDDYGKVVVLWSAMFVGLSILCRPIEQLLSTSVASLRARGESTKHALRVAAQIQLAVMVGFVVLATVFREPIEEDLFGGDELFFWCLVASIVGFGVSFFARGVLAGGGRFLTFAAIVATDAISRTAFALAVTIGILNGADPMALGIALAPFISAAVWPIANVLVSRRGHRTPRGAPNPESADPNFTLTEGTGFATGLLFVMLGEQVLLNSGPLLAQMEVGAATAGFIFNVLLVLRAPVLVFQAAAAVLLPHLTEIQDSGRAEGDGEFGRSVRVTLTAILGFGVVTLVIVATLGPALMQIAFGEKFDYPRADLLIVAAGLPFYLAATTLTQASLARRRVSAVAFAWSAAAGALIAWYAVSPLEVSRTVEVGIAGASALLFALLWLLYRAGPPARTA